MKEQIDPDLEEGNNNNEKILNQSAEEEKFKEEALKYLQRIKSKVAKNEKISTA